MNANSVFAVKDAQKPVLILGADHVVIEQETNILKEPLILYKTEHQIKGCPLNKHSNPIINSHLQVSPYM